MKNKQKVFVTGGSRGIGAAIAIEFAKNGYDVAIGYNQGEKEAENVANYCRNFGVDALIVQGNLSSKTDILNIRATLLEHWKGIHVLVNNAGIAHYGMFQDASWDDVSKVIDTNVKGTCMITRALVDIMIEQRYGRIINLSSIWGVYGGSFEVLYSLSKGALNAFTQALSKELEGTGVTVNAIAPGAVQTRMMEDMSEEDVAIVQSDIPLGRIALPSEISGLVAHLCKKESAVINGQILLIHGGWHQ